MIDTALTIEVDHLTPNMVVSFPDVDNEGQWEDEEHTVTAVHPNGYHVHVAWKNGGITLGSGREVLLVSWGGA